MLTARSKRLLGSGAAIALIVIGVAATLRWRSPPAPQYLRLKDGTEAFFLGDSKVTPAAGFPRLREIHVDGDTFFRVPENPKPLTVRSRLLVLTVTGKTAFRLTAYSKEAGEQVEVLYGNVKATKNYPSNYMEPDLLTAGQMSMINRDIDLMEKETTNLGELKAWSEKLIASASRQAR